jgi:hypothetical protein
MAAKTNQEHLMIRDVIVMMSTTHVPQLDHAMQETMIALQDMSGIEVTVGDTGIGTEVEAGRETVDGAPEGKVEAEGLEVQRAAVMVGHKPWLADRH